VATPILMYHELSSPGRETCESTPGYLRYVVDQSVLANQLSWLAASGLSAIGIAAAQARGFDRTNQVVVTFDDGCETDLDIAAPLLAQWGFGATFYVVSGWLGRRRGFMTAPDLRRLYETGFEIGSHSVSHAFLSDLDDAALDREVRDSKRALEDVIGGEVLHLSCPGGRWSRRVATAARAAGYQSVSTSRLGVNRAGSDWFNLARCAIRADTPARTFESISAGHGLGRLQLQDRLMTVAKRTLGTRLYTNLRDLALKHH
jgi:peptidoglycan/xylan/chitin deacetylase (PgdA/CDA1 family)